MNVRLGIGSFITAENERNFRSGRTYSSINLVNALIYIESPFCTVHYTRHCGFSGVLFGWPSFV